MSYVDLKHLLADLALEAVRDPSRAAWVRPLAAYAAAATPNQPTVKVPHVEGIARLVDARLLEHRNGRVRCRGKFVPYLAYLQQQTGRLAAAIDHLASSSAPRGVPDDLVVGAALFNAGLYFEAHELLETTWRAAAGPERDFYHGIVQAAAAFYHFEKRNMHGARTLLAKSIRRLAPYPSSYLGVDVAHLGIVLTEWQEYLTAPRDTAAHPPSRPILRFSSDVPAG